MQYRLHAIHTIFVKVPKREDLEVDPNQKRDNLETEKEDFIIKYFFILIYLSIWII